MCGYFNILMMMNKKDNHRFAIVRRWIRIGFGWLLAWPASISQRPRANGGGRRGCCQVVVVVVVCWGPGRPAEKFHRASRGNQDSAHGARQWRPLCVCVRAAQQLPLPLALSNGRGPATPIGRVCRAFRAGTSALRLPRGPIDEQSRENAPSSRRALAAASLHDQNNNIKTRAILSMKK
jgi:hypothetical protein